MLAAIPAPDYRYDQCFRGSALRGPGPCAGRGGGTSIALGFLLQLEAFQRWTRTPTRNRSHSRRAKASSAATARPNKAGERLPAEGAGRASLPPCFFGTSFKASQKAGVYSVSDKKVAICGLFRLFRPNPQPHLEPYGGGRSRPRGRSPSTTPAPGARRRPPRKDPPSPPRARGGSACSRRRAEAPCARWCPRVGSRKSWCSCRRPGRS